jgi:hypothetical protein
MAIEPATRENTGDRGRPRPLRLAFAFLVALLVTLASNAVLTLTGCTVLSAPDELCARLPVWSVPVSVLAIAALTACWVALAGRGRLFYQLIRLVVLVSLAPGLLQLVTWRSLSGAITVLLMILVGATASYLALTRIAGPSGPEHLGDQERQLQ